MLQQSFRRALFAACGVVVSALTAGIAHAANGYDLIFADNFNGTALDTTKWSAASPGWTMPNSLSTASADQVSVGGGTLTLNATRTGANTFSSGSVSTYQKYNLASGYVEARIDLPSTPGSWPAFWGLYDGWPPETDIMEYPLTADGVNGYANNAYHTAYHYTNGSGAAASGAGQVTTGTNLGTTGYHTFAAEWVAGTGIKFLLDGNQVSSYTGTSVAQMASMYMILDYAVGGWPGTPSTGQWAVGASDQMKVDWVRVWQKNPTNDAASTWNVDGGGSFTAAANWTGGGVPGYGNQTAIFGRVGTAATAAVTLDNWRVIGGLTFDGSGTGTTAYTLGTAANALQLANDVTAGPVVQATANSTASQSINARVEFVNNTTARNDMTGGQTLNFNGELSGEGALNVTGVGTTVVNAPGTYTGGTNVGTAAEAAVLRVTADRALGTGGVVIGPSGNGTTARLELAGGHAIPNNVDLRGRNNNSVAIRNVDGNNAIGGTITANVGGGTYQIQSDAGTLTLAGGSPNATAAGVALQAGSGSRTFTLQGAGNGVVSGAIQNGGGTVALTKEGAGTWTLAGANTYTGATTINGGTLRLAAVADTAIASYSFDAVAGGTVANGGTGGAAMNGTLAGGAAIVSGGRFGNAVSLAGGASVDIANPIADLGSNASWTVASWVKTTTAGSSILTKGNGGWSSGNTIFYLGDGSAGGSGAIPSAVRWGGGFVQGSAAATPVADGAWHQVAYVNSNGTYSIYVDGVAQPLAAGNSAMAGNDVGSIVRLGASTNTFAGDGTVNFNGLLDGVQFYGQALSTAQIASLYSGVSNAALPSATNVTIAGGATLDVNGTVQQIGPLNGVAGSTVTLGNGRLTVASEGGSNFAGTIGGAGGSLVKAGAGAMTLSGANTFTGGASVTGGTLLADSESALGTGPIAVSAGGTLAVAAGRHVAGLAGLSVAAGGTLSFDGGSELLLNSGAFTLGDLTLDLNHAYDAVGAYTLIDGVAGANAIGQATFVDVSPAYRYALSVVGTDVVLTVSAVPEPATLAAVSLGALLLVRRRRVG